MKTDYDFEQDLATLRVLLSREHQFSEGRRYVTVGHDNIKGLVILMEDWLREDCGIEDKDERREIRLGILSLITESKVTTTYDLTLYQCSTISYFLRHGPEDPDEESVEEPSYILTDRAKWFLEDCQARSEGKDVYRTGRNENRAKPKPLLQRRVPPDLSDLFETHP